MRVRMSAALRYALRRLRRTGQRCGLAGGIGLRERSPMQQVTQSGKQARPRAAQESDVAGQLMVRQLLSGHAMRCSPCDQPCVLLPALVAGFADDARDILSGLCRPRVLAARDLSSRCFEKAPVLALVVERRYDNLPSFMPFRVVAIVLHDEAPDAVILRIYLRHRESVRLRNANRGWFLRQGLPDSARSGNLAELRMSGPRVPTVSGQSPRHRRHRQSTASRPEIGVANGFSGGAARRTFRIGDAANPDACHRSLRAGGPYAESG